MKTIIAIIRPERVGETRSALEAIGFKGVTFLHVTGKGRQKGKIQTSKLAGPLSGECSIRYPFKGEQTMMELCHGEYEEKELEIGFVPKRMLIIVAHDSHVSAVVQTIIHTNQKGHHGDGRIFVCPVISALRVRTGEQGDRALS